MKAEGGMLSEKPETKIRFWRFDAQPSGGKLEVQSAKVAVRDPLYLLLIQSLIDRSVGPDDARLVEDDDRKIGGV